MKNSNNIKACDEKALIREDGKSTLVVKYGEYYNEK
tara:strand:+ start:81 stop:188 length:108 start_codon:yes stop_codon:yes gene_type:complete